MPHVLLVDGTWRPASDGGELEVVDPATGEVLCRVADATPADGLAALGAAHAAQAAWGRTAPATRARVLRRAQGLLEERAEHLALVLTLEMGKPLDEARAEVAYAADYLGWFAGEAERIAGHYGQAVAGSGRVLESRSPVGPCLLITPWNFPMAMGARKVAPAIAAGCTMVVKPAPQTPLSMLALAEVLQEAGLPDGVLNVLPTSAAAELTEVLLADPRLRKLSFTGSTAVGRRLIAGSSQQVLRTSMELGGNAAFLVCEDADLDRAVQGALAAKMRNAGEACTSANRFLVHEAVAEDFGARLAAAMGAMRSGHGTTPGVRVGPLIDRAAQAKVGDLVEDAAARGARVLTGGAVPDGPGSFYPPTVLDGVAPGTRLLREEVFGPVAPIVAVPDDDTALELANDTEHGLAAYVFTENLDRALALGDGLQAGMVGVNTGVVSSASVPFGGVKHSGFGREGGRAGIEEYLDTRLVVIAA